MRYGAIPENPLERWALRRGLLPRAAVDALLPLVQTRALMAASSLGVFAALADGPRDAEAVAAALELDAAATADLLRVLVHAGHLEWRDARFALTADSRRNLLPRRDGRATLASYLAWNYVQWDFVGRLEELLRTGQGIDFHRSMTDPGHWRRYQESMLAFSRAAAPVLVRHIPVRRGARRLLDVAGGHGCFGAALCRAHPPLRSTVLDLPAALDAALALARAEGWTDVVEHRAGDLAIDPWGTDWDVVLLSNILHHFPQDPAQAILRRAAEALAPGGTVAIWEFERPDPRQRPSVGDAAALYFRLTSGAGCHRGAEYAQWLEAAGFKKIRIVRPLATPGSVLVRGAR